MKTIYFKLTFFLFFTCVLQAQYVFNSKIELHTAVNTWFNDKTNAESIYGNINNWNVSAITDMSKLFMFKITFNDNIGNWDVSNVTDMSKMFTLDYPIN